MEAGILRVSAIPFAQDDEFGGAWRKADSSAALRNDKQRALRNDKQRAQSVNALGHLDIRQAGTRNYCPKMGECFGLASLVAGPSTA
jgi:hypothetical protein